MGKKIIPSNRMSLNIFIETATQAAALLRERSDSAAETLFSFEASENIDQISCLVQRLLSLYPEAKKENEDLQKGIITIPGKSKSELIQVKSFLNRQFLLSLDGTYKVLISIANYQLEVFFESCQNQQELSDKKCKSALDYYKQAGTLGLELDSSNILSGSAQLTTSILLSSLLKKLALASNPFLIAVPLGNHISTIEKMVRSAYVREKQRDLQISFAAYFTKICFLIGKDNYGLNFIRQLLQDTALKEKTRNSLVTAYEYAIQIELLTSYSSMQHQQLKEFPFVKKLVVAQQILNLCNENLELLKKITELPLLDTVEAFKKLWNRDTPGKSTVARNNLKQIIEVLYDYALIRIKNIHDMRNIHLPDSMDVHAILSQFPESLASYSELMQKQSTVHNRNYFHEVKAQLFFVEDLFIFIEDQVKRESIQIGDTLYEEVYKALVLGIQTVLAAIPRLQQITLEQRKVIQEELEQLQQEEPINSTELEELIASIEEDTKKSQKLFKKATAKKIKPKPSHAKTSKLELDDVSTEVKTDNSPSFQDQINLKMSQARYFWQNYHFSQSDEAYREALRLATTAQEAVSITQIKFAMAGVKLSEVKKHLIKLPRYISSMNFFLKYDLTKTYDQRTEAYCKDRILEVWNHLDVIFNSIQRGYPLIIAAIGLFNEAMTEVLALLNSDLSSDKREQLELAPEILREYLQDTDKKLKLITVFTEILPKWSAKHKERMIALGHYGQKEAVIPTKKNDHTTTIECIQTYIQQQQPFISNKLTEYLTHQQLLSSWQERFPINAVTSDVPSGAITPPAVNDIEKKHIENILETQCQMICQEDTPFCVQNAEKYLELLEQCFNKGEPNRENIFPFLTTLYLRWSESQALDAQHKKTILMLFHLGDYTTEAHAVFTGQPDEALTLHYCNLLVKKITEDTALDSAQVQILFDYLTQAYLFLVKQHWTCAGIGKKLHSLIKEQPSLAESFCSAFIISLENDFSSPSFVHQLYWGICVLGEARAKLLEKIPNPKQLCDFASWECAFSVPVLTELQAKESFNFDAFRSQLRWSLSLKVHGESETVIPTAEHLNVLAQGNSLSHLMVQINAHIRLSIFYMFGIGLKTPLYQEAKTLLDWVIKEAATPLLAEKDQVFWRGIAKSYWVLAKQLQSNLHLATLVNPAQMQDGYQPRFFSGVETSCSARLPSQDYPTQSGNYKLK